MRSLHFLLCGLWLAPCAWALGPKAPFTPPSLPTAPVAAPAPAATPALNTNPLRTMPVLQGLRTGAQPMALMADQWWPVGTGPAGTKLVAIDTHGVWIQAPGAAPELAGSPAPGPASPAMAGARNTAIRLSLLPAPGPAPIQLGAKPELGLTPKTRPAATLALQTRSAP